MKTGAIKLLAASAFLNLAIPVFHASGAAGDLDLSFNPTFETVEQAYRFLLQPDGRIIVSGTANDGLNLGAIDRLYADGSLDTTFHFRPPATNYYVGPIALQPDGKVIVVYSPNGSNPRVGLVRLSADGSVDDSFSLDPAAAMFFIRSVAFQPDGKILLAGASAVTSNAIYYGVVRLNSDGSLDSTFERAIVGFFYWVGAVAVQSDGKILIGGWFNSVNGVGRTNIARLNADGSLDSAFNACTGGRTLNPGVSGNIVYAVAVQPDGKVLIGGDFYVVNGMSRDRLARLNADGSLDDTFDPKPPPFTGITCLALQPDGKVVVGGGFTTEDYGLNDYIYVSPMIARLNGDGSFDSGFRYWGSGSMSGAAPEIGQLTLQPDGKLLVSGGFTSLDGVTRAGMARLVGGPSDRPPVADASATKSVWVSTNGSNAVLTLDASRSSDPDGDPLQYTWYGWPASLYATGVVAEAVLPLGEETVQLWVSDGLLWTNTAITVEVITIAQGFERLLSLVDLKTPRPQPLTATLGAALDSLSRSNPISAANQLHAFQNQVRAQVSPHNPLLAQTLMQGAQDLLDVFTNE